MKRGEKATFIGKIGKIAGDKQEQICYCFFIRTVSEATLFGALFQAFFQANWTAVGKSGPHGCVHAVILFILDS